MPERIGDIMKERVKQRILLIIGLAFGAGVLLIIVLIGINLYMKAVTKNRILTAEEAAELNADCILVLGAGVWEDGRPSMMLADRLKQGIELYKSGVSDRLLMSGDHGRMEYDEVNVMKDYAVERGVPSGHIFMDHAGFSTYDSMYRARDIFGAKKIIIVTQKYHMYRALYIARALGLEAYGVNSDPREYQGQRYREIREFAARIKDFFFVVIKPEPTYLGDAIPVSGDGDVTNDR
jgi:vancomycin permeability regulator SanA